MEIPLNVVCGEQTPMLSEHGSRGLDPEWWRKYRNRLPRGLMESAAWESP